MLQQKERMTTSKRMDIMQTLYQAISVKPFQLTAFR